jgi:hypothetical protein
MLSPVPASRNIFLSRGHEPPWLAASKSAMVLIFIKNLNKTKPRPYFLYAAKIGSRLLAAEESKYGTQKLCPKTTKIGRR